MPTLERNILGPNENHCPRCLEATALGWVIPGILLPVGRRWCKHKCRCRIERKTVQEGGGMGEFLQSRLASPATGAIPVAAGVASQAAPAASSGFMAGAMGFGRWMASGVARAVKGFLGRMGR